jgi:hypothetical protein
MGANRQFGRGQGTKKTRLVAEAGVEFGLENQGFA